MGFLGGRSVKELRCEDIAFMMSSEIGVKAFYKISTMYGIDDLLKFYESDKWVDYWLEQLIKNKEFFFYFIPVPRQQGMTMIITLLDTNYSVMLYCTSLYFKKPVVSKVEPRLRKTLQKYEKLIRCYGGKLTRDCPPPLLYPLPNGRGLPADRVK